MSTKRGQPQMAAWDAALARVPAPPLIITSELQDQIGNWSLPEGDNNKRALLDGKVPAGRDIAAAPPVGNGQVRWQDGRIKAVPVLSVAQAVRSLAELGPGKSGSCGECRPLILGSPRLITVKVGTATGPATAPAWSFAVRGSKVRVTRVAAGPAPYPDVRGLPYGAVSQDAGMTVHVDGGGGLVVSFTAGPPASAGPCGSDYTGRLVEAQWVVAVLLDKIPSGGTRPPASRAAKWRRTAPSGSCPPIRSASASSSTERPEWQCPEPERRSPTTWTTTCGQGGKHCCTRFLAREGRVNPMNSAPASSRGDFRRTPVADRTGVRPAAADPWSTAPGLRPAAGCS